MKVGAVHETILNGIMEKKRVVTEKLTVPQLIKFTQPESSSTCSQNRETRPYPG